VGGHVGVASSNVIALASAAAQDCALRVAPLDQADVAERAGVHVNTISAMERRGSELLVSGLDVVAKVARLLEDAGVILIRSRRDAEEAHGGSGRRAKGRRWS
jgi:transcriptional regulator with XRE-family HTH domain